MEPWAKQKALSLAGYIPTQKELLDIAQTIKSPRDKSLFLLTYLTAGRISEVVAILASSIELTYRENREVMLVHLPNRKNRTRHTKDIGIPLDREFEAAMAKEVMDYARTTTGLLFGISTTRAWQILNSIGYNPHWLRHIRLTHMETIYGMSGERVKILAGWTDTRPAKHYMELNWGDVLKGM